MLILTRRRGEAICIGENVKVIVRGVRGRYVDIGIDAPQELSVHRQEVWYRIKCEQEASNKDDNE